MALYTGYSLQPGSTVYYTTELPSFYLYYGYYEFDSSEQQIAREVFDEWDNSLNLTFEYTSDYYRADINLVSTYIDGEGGTLGVWSPSDPDGDGVLSGGIDEGYAFIYMDYYDTDYFRQTLAHEVGHALGLDHDETEGTLMNTLLDGTETITEYDISKAAAIYGYSRGGSENAENWDGSQTGDMFNMLGGDDVVRAGTGDDTVFGGTGSDVLSGDSGTDYLSGEAGNDLIYGNKEVDSLAGGDGDDTIFGGQNSGAPRADASGLMRQQDGVETIDGGAGNDLIYGNFGNEVLSGGDGNDTIFGGQNEDTLDGGAGDDFLAGNRGYDILTGGSGADTFAFGGAGQNDDVITDFNASEGDRLSFSGTYTTATTDGNLVVTYGGGTITLTGVSQAEFGSGWIA